MAVETTETTTISAMKKITFSFRAGSQQNQNDLNPENTMFHLIYGVGTEGLTPFEFELDGKTVGESISLALHPDDICKTFKHISLPDFKVPENADQVYLTFKVEKITEAGSREIIKAMAEQSSCGGGSCECCGH